MLRMAHRIATASVWSAHGVRPERIESTFRSLQMGARGATVIVADNIADFYETCGKDSYDLVTDFPGCRPFETSVFIEWFSKANNAQVGCLVEFVDEPARELYGFMMGFAASTDGDVVVIGWTLFIDLSETGEIDGWRLIPRGGLSREEAMQQLGICMGMVHIPLLTMSFANCKNVTRRDATELHGPSAKWLRRQKVGGIRYHVLDINPMKEVLRSEGGIETNGLKKALHICRGHFAHYDNGLFGRGEPCTVWKPAHVRGKAEHGIVLKDYEVKVNQ